jgi:uncharacterized protein (DUF2062 family)
MTFLTNPATTPLIIAASIYVGNTLGYHVDLISFQALYSNGAGLREWTGWLLSDAAPALLVGQIVISTVVAATGYFVSAFVWRWWIGHKRRVRQGITAQSAE